MKKVLAILLLAITVFACRNNNDKVSSDIEKIGVHFISSQFSSGEKVDTIKLVKYDTLTSEVENDYLWYEYDKLSKKEMEEALLLKDHYDVKHRLNELKPSTQLVSEMDELESRFDNIKRRGMYYDSVASVFAEKRKTVNKTDFKGYRGYFRVKYTDVTGAQKTIDSFETTINPDFKIRLFKDEVKHPIK